jgi:tetratricopeptide (TPR) repeat protein
VESDRPLDEGGWAPLRCLVNDRWKYIRSPRPELYDLISDPHELKDLTGLHATEVQEFERALQDRERRFVLRAAPSVISSPHERRKLASLGYAGGGTERDADFEARADIKDVLPHYNAYTDAQRLIAMGKFAEAAALLEPVVKATPEYFQAWYNLGVAYQQLKRLPDAEEAFGRAVDLDSNVWSRLALGKVCLLQGKIETSIPQFEAAVQIQPEIAEAQYFLGEAYRQTGRTKEARAQYQQALEADPGYSPATQALQVLP